MNTKCNKKKIRNTKVCKWNFVTHQSLVNVMEKGLKAFVESIDQIHFVNL
jgi:hypothetical protein